MARLFDDASTQYAENAGAVLTGYPLTMAGWFNSDSITLGQCIVSIGDTGSGARFGILAAGNAGGDPVQVIASSTNAFSSTGYTANTWHHACGVFASATSRSAYLNGGGKQTSVTSATPSGLDTTDIGRLYSSAPGNYFSGMLAEVAIWDAALDDAEVASLARGLSPLLVRPSNLVAYWPLVGRNSPETDPVGGFDLTLIGPPVAADHPPVYYPRRPWPFGVSTSATTYTITADAGAYTLTGSAAGLLFGRRLTAAAGAYALTGSAATLKVARLLSAAAGAYAVTGSSAGLYKGRTLVAGAGSYGLSGSAAALKVARKIVASAGTYALTGSDATLTYTIVSTSGRVYILPATGRTFVLPDTDRSYP